MCGVTTTTALSAQLTARLKPTSMPAGQSTKNVVETVVKPSDNFVYGVGRNLPFCRVTTAHDVQRRLVFVANQRLLGSATTFHYVHKVVHNLVFDARHHVKIVKPYVKVNKQYPEGTPRQSKPQVCANPVVFPTPPLPLVTTIFLAICVLAAKPLPHCGAKGGHLLLFRTIVTRFLQQKNPFDKVLPTGLVEFILFFDEIYQAANANSY